MDLTTGEYSTALGYYALADDTSGEYNTAIGCDALPDSTTGNDNTATGYQALMSNQTGNANTADGAGALAHSTATGNTAEGFEALYNTTTGFSDTANGVGALVENTTGSYDTAVGYETSYHNTTGSYNTSSGTAALAYTTTGTQNTADGAYALESNATGNGNTGGGVSATDDGNNTTTSDNTGFGSGALAVAGSQNTGVGFGVGYSSTAVSEEFYNEVTVTGSGETFLGWRAGGPYSGNYNSIFGYSAGQTLQTGRNNIYVDNQGAASESGATRLGTENTQTSTYIAGISGVTVASGAGVVIDSTGYLGVTTSSARFKDEIKPMAQASESIFALQPVTFHYKSELDPNQIPQFGLVAEQVEKVNPDLVLRNAEGQVYTVRYEAVNAMLLNEFLKEHRHVEDQASALTQLAAAKAKRQETITRLQSSLASLTATSKAQTALLDKVSTQLGGCPAEAAPAQDNP